jgi:hypothetical protein
MLVDDGVRLVKLFLHMSDEEQLRRFRERVITATKHWNMTAEDIRNRARRREYLAALDDMFALTSTAAAPWYVVPAEYKWYTRIAVATTAVKILAKGITVEPPALDPKVPPLSFLGLVEVRREAVGVHRGHPFQIGNNGLGLPLGNAEIRHCASPSAVLLGVHQEFDHRALSLIGAGDGSIRESLRQKEIR